MKNPIVKYSLVVIALIVGIFLGSTVNMSIIKFGELIISLPEGLDNKSAEGLKATMHLMEAQHFIFPFLAHAVGTLFGAFVVAFSAIKLSFKNPLKIAILIGVFFLCGGIYMVYILPSPLWFSLTDLIFAYLPMAYLGGKLAEKIKDKR